MLPLIIVGGALLNVIVPVRRLGSIFLTEEMIRNRRISKENELYKRYARMRINPDKVKRDQGMGMFSGYRLIIYPDNMFPDHMKWIAGEYFLDSEEEAQLDTAIDFEMAGKGGSGIDIGDMKVRSEERINDPLFCAQYKEQKKEVETKSETSTA